MRYWLLLVFAVLLIPFSSAQLDSDAELDSKIASSCGENFEPVISISDPSSTDSHPAKPNYYSQNLCISGIEDSSIQTSCKENTGFYISGKEDNSHFSVFESYNLHLCTGSMKVNVNQSCNENSTALFSVSGKDNAHLAAPNVFESKGCGKFKPPENVTLEVEFNLSSSDQVYFDNQQFEGEKTYYPPAKFPYLVSVSENHIGGIVVPTVLRAERNIEEKNIISITRSSSTPSFFIPLTEGNTPDIEDREKSIINRGFLGKIRPSFGFPIPKQPIVKVLLRPDTEIESDIDIPPGSYNLKIEKIGENKIEISTEQ